MGKTRIIVFSKCRTLQLKSLLLSLRHFSDVDESDICVLYTTTEDISYQPLIDTFGCRFVEEHAFLDDVTNLVSDDAADYVSFMVDDLICRDAFSLRHVEQFLDGHPDVDCFSLRLGRHIADEPAPDFSVRGDGVLVWDTAAQLGTSWRYFWELSSSVYRREQVLGYLGKCDPRKVTFPNPLEFNYYALCPSHLIPGSGWKLLARRALFLGRSRTNRMACFERSKCFTQGVNLVAARQIDYETLHEPQALHEKMLEGFVIDYRPLQTVENRKPNAGSTHFRLVREDEITA